MSDSIVPKPLTSGAYLKVQRDIEDLAEAREKLMEITEEVARRQKQLEQDMLAFDKHASLLYRVDPPNFIPRQLAAMDHLAESLKSLKFSHALDDNVEIGAGKIEAEKAMAACFKALMEDEGDQSTQGQGTDEMDAGQYIEHVGKVLHQYHLRNYRASGEEVSDCSEESDGEEETGDDEEAASKHEGGGKDDDEVKEEIKED